MKKPFEVLVDDYIRRVFNYEDDSVAYFWKNHPTRFSPYRDCGDMTCEHAREFARRIIDALEASGFTIVKGPPVIYVDGETYDVLQAALQQPPRVIPKLRDALRREQPEGGSDLIQ